MENELESWLRDRPQIIKDLCHKYPPGDYIIKDGAPYGTSGPGCRVTLNNYNEDGKVGVVVLAKYKTREALEHEFILSTIYSKDLNECSKQDVLCTIDPIWMEKID